jgi:hypothetical protein
MPRTELRLVPVQPDLREGEDALVDPAALSSTDLTRGWCVLAGSPAAAGGWEGAASLLHPCQVSPFPRSGIQFIDEAALTCA